MVNRLAILLSLWTGVALAQTPPAPALPQMEIFWIEKRSAYFQYVLTDSLVDIKITWYPSATLDTNEVQFAEFDLDGNLLKTCGVKCQSDTASKITLIVEGFQRESVVYMRWRSYNTAGSSPWSADPNWFVTHQVAETPVLLYPPNNAVKVKE